MITIRDVEVRPIEQIHDKRGKVMHMLKRTDPWFTKFGEIYFSVAHPGIIKGWHRHTKMTLNYVCVYGKIKLVIHDGMNAKELFIGPENYQLVTIPPGLWNGFEAIGKTDAIVANCSDIPHDPHEIERLDPNLPMGEGISYQW